MQRGLCPKCGAVDQRFYEIDRKHKHRALKCFQCGKITHYVRFNGRIYQPPPWEPEHELSTRFDAYIYGANRAGTAVTDPGRSRDLL